MHIYMHTYMYTYSSMHECRHVQAVMRTHLGAMARARPNRHAGVSQLPGQVLRKGPSVYPYRDDLKFCKGSMPDPAVAKLVEGSWRGLLGWVLHLLLKGPKSKLCAFVFAVGAS